MTQTASIGNGSAAGSAATGQQDRAKQDTLSPVLGWASLGLGIPQVTMPGQFDHLIGVKPDAENRALTLAVGVRELVAAAGILAIERPRPVRFLWARVAGDLIDLTLLARALRRSSESRTRTIAAIGAVVGIAATDIFAALRVTREPDRTTGDDKMHLHAAITVAHPREAVYQRWHEFGNLPSFMAHLESVEQVSDTRSHWTATAPAGRKVEWDAEVIEDRPGERISWRSIDGSSVESSGTVRFTEAPGNRGTEVHLEMSYSTPGGALGATAAKLFGEEPRQQVKDDLRRFKQVMEAGLVVRSEGSPEGPLARRMLKQRPAQPLPDGSASSGGAS